MIVLMILAAFVFDALFTLCVTGPLLMLALGYVHTLMPIVPAVGYWQAIVLTLLMLAFGVFHTFAKSAGESLVKVADD